jgi:hypothetical protein
MKVGNLVKRSDPSWDTVDQLGLVIAMETVEYSPKVAKVQWLGGDYPSFMYRPNDLILVSEVK